MGAVWFEARSLLRRRIGTTVALTLALAIAGGVTIACTAGARRTADALPSFLDHFHGQDVSAFVFAGSVPEPAARAFIDDVRALPQWEGVGTGRPLLVSLAGRDGWVVQVAIATDTGDYRRAWDRPIVVDGRLPDPERRDEITVNEAFASSLGLDVGDTLPLRTITPERLQAASEGTITRDPAGEDHVVTVAAIIRQPVDLAADQGGTAAVFGQDSWLVELTPAFLENAGDRIASYGLAAQGRARPGEAPALARAITDLAAEAEIPAEVEEGSETEESLAAIRRGIDVERAALLIFAAVTLLTGAALLGQLIGREVTLDLADGPALRAAGMTRRQRALPTVARAAVVASAGAVGALALAIAASWLFPVGLARRAEPDPGVAVDLPVLLAGAGLLVALVLARAGVGAWRGADQQGRDPRPLRVSRLVAVLGAAGAPVPLVGGARLALERGRGRSAVPVVGAMLATSAGVLALSALLVANASATHLLATPALQGWTWDVTVDNLNDPDSLAQAIAVLRDDPAVERFTGFSSGGVVVDGRGVSAARIGVGDPSAGPRADEGRLPVTASEVAVGRQTLHDLGKEIGDEVELAAGPGAPTHAARIVGTVTLPAALDEQLTPGRGVLVTLDGATRLSGSDEPEVANTLLVDFTDGTSIEDGARSLEAAFPATTGRARPPDEVANLARVQRLPRLLALLITMLAIGTLANTLFTSVRVHRRDLATLTALGLRRRQLGSTLVWQAVALAVVGIAVGVPLGVAAGRTAWALLMGATGLAAAPAVPLALLAGLVVAVLVAALLTAVLPARVARRTRVAAFLRTE